MLLNYNKFDNKTEVLYNSENYPSIYSKNYKKISNDSININNKLQTSKRNYFRRKNTYTNNTLNYLKGINSNNIITEDIKDNYWNSIFINKENALMFKNYLKDKFSINKINYLINNEKTKVIKEDHNKYLNAKYKSLIIKTSSSYTCLDNILKKFLVKRHPPYLSYNNFEINLIQSNLLKLIDNNLYNKVVDLDTIYFYNYYNKNQKTDYKIFSNAYGNQIKNINLFNKKSFISKNLKTSCIIWPLIKKEDTSKVLNIENIYDAVFGNKLSNSNYNNNI